ncbi:MAG: PIG-L family deacetylase [Chloroflexi bacterium]|nr:PIG-L family deacetylase [Chloroflexota bacterium]MBV9597544.1 PIG-L family deacetylase [Chloroflexota bacterium]
MTDTHRNFACVGQPCELAAGRAVFLSSHYDDVALSCGGTVALLAERGPEPVIVTIFGGEVTDEVLNQFARWKHGRWGLTDMDSVREQRQAEDTAAAHILRTGTRWLGIPDAIYRGEHHLSDDELYGEVQAAELPLAQLIADEVQALPEWSDTSTVFVPLGAGRHVDHQLVFLAGRHLADRSVQVLAYEDCPYVIHTPLALETRLAELSDCLGAPRYVKIASTFERKLAAIEAYATQVPVLFRFTSDVRGELTKFGQRMAPELGAVERFWPVLPQAPI